MRSFGSLAFRQVRARRLRSLLTAAGIVLGVGMILGVLLLAVTINGTFDELFDSVYGRTDLIVSGEGGDSLRAGTLERVRSVPGVAQVSGQVTGVFNLVRDGVASTDQTDRLNVSGLRAAATELTDARTVDGRRARSGKEVALQTSWADAEHLEVGDRVPLATPNGVEHLRVVGLFQFTSGFDFGGQGFAYVPLATARRLLDKPHAYDEVDLAVSGGQETIDSVQRRLDRQLPKGVKVETPQNKSDDVEAQLQAFNTILYFFAAMALFVGGFLIFNSFNMTVFQRTREIGMLRTLGAGRGRITGSVLREAALLGLVGALLGLGLGLALAAGLIQLVRAFFSLPVGALSFSAFAPIAAVATCLVTATLGALCPARRAGRTSPIRAVLGTEGLRSRPRPRRALLGALLIPPGLAGAFWLGAANETTTTVAVAGIAGTLAIFFGIALLAPFVIGPLARALAWPVRQMLPVEGRLAAEAARADPGRTAATATALMIGLALVVAVNSLGASFLQTISDEFDRDFARDLTVQPSGFAPGQGPQQTIAKSLRSRLARIPEAAVVAEERFLFTPNLPAPKGQSRSDGLLVAFDPQEYEKVDETDIEGASRAEVFRRLAHGEITLGRGQADETGLEVGDHLTLRGPSGSQRARVAGIVQTVAFGGQTVGMSLDTMRKVYGVTADSELALKATSESTRPILERKVDRVVQRHYPNLAVLSQDELKSTIENQVNQQFAIFYAIVGVAIFASLFGIVNTLTMSVIERTREIGVLRALGAGRWQIRRMVASESVVIGLIGALLGIAVGTGLGAALLQGLASGVPGIQYHLPLATVAVVATAGVGLGLVASVLPARRAARLDVIRAVSYE